MSLNRILSSDLKNQSPFIKTLRSVKIKSIKNPIILKSNRIKQQRLFKGKPIANLLLAKISS